ncbi:MAG: acyltransferase [Gammaproteobacteria bacterium]|nr:acyltransferase [Gammaproteobacteria bacterium]
MNGGKQDSSGLDNSDQEGLNVVIVEHEERSAAVMFIKRSVQVAFSLWVSPRVALYYLFGRLLGPQAFLHASESIGKVPGLWGIYCRQAFYRATLYSCGQDCYFGWLSTFSIAEARVGRNVYLGRRCSIGFADIGDHVMLADGVQILSGGREHGLATGSGETHQEQAREFRRVTIGEGAWLGTNCIIMADVGAHAVVGAGAVVTKPVPPYGIAVGIPAKVLRVNAPASP